MAAFSSMLDACQVETQQTPLETPASARTRQQRSASLPPPSEAATIRYIKDKANRKLSRKGQQLSMPMLPPSKAATLRYIKDKSTRKLPRKIHLGITRSVQGKTGAASLTSAKGTLRHCRSPSRTLRLFFASAPAGPKYQHVQPWERVNIHTWPGKFYFFNRVTGQSAWAMGQSAVRVPKFLAEPWDQIESRKLPGTFYYYNRATGQSAVQMPEDLAEA